MKVLHLFSKHRPSQSLILEGGDYTHLIRSYRAKLGQSVACVVHWDGRALCFSGTISSIEKRSCTLDIKPSSPEELGLWDSPRDTWMMSSLCKGDVGERIIRQSVEVGVSHLVLIHSDHSVVDQKVLSDPRKQARWRQIIVEAAQQSGRFQLPQLFFASSVHDGLEKVPQAATILFCDEHEEGIEKPTTQDLISSTPVLVLGPEGGWSEKERSYIVSMDRGLRVHWPTPILRADTAAVYSIAYLHSLLPRKSP